ncbi:tetratricopeptide repeat protein [Aquimarina sp. 2201CG1-2-11]|uniref:tetratricopeptide repeat protein n=1 Tax=Aquimarina discodermiae TaxID=3231043 RepID=UPI0034633916
MADQEKDITFIIRYFDFDLSEDELLVFEKRIEDDPEFAKKVTLYKDSIDIVEEAYQTNADKARIEQWKTQLNANQKAKSNKLSWKWIGGIAATIALLFFGWQLNTKSQQNIEVALTEAWHKKVGLDYKSLRNTKHDSLKSILLTAVDSYENEQYQYAINTLARFNTTIPYYEDALLIKGLSYYKKGAIEKALQTLDTLTQHHTQRKAKVARWYQGLIYLEMGKKQKAKEFLQLPNRHNPAIQLKE